MTVEKMSNKGTYQVMVDGEATEFNSVKDVSRFLGEERLGETKLRKADIVDGLYVDGSGDFAIVFVPEGELVELPEVSIEPEAGTPADITAASTEVPVDDAPTDDAPTDDESSDDNNDEGASDDNADDGGAEDEPISEYDRLMAQLRKQGPPVKKGKQALAGQTVEYPEKGHFADEKALKKFYRQLSDAQLDEWIGLEGLTWNSCDNESINRMRRCMAIRELHFPTNTGGNKKSKYAKYTDEQLLEMCVKNGLEVKVPKKFDKRIMRMYSIMALKDAKVLS